MDLSRTVTSGEPLLDHRLLIAAAAVRQAATRTARLAGETDLPQAEQEPLRALVATFGGRVGDRGGDQAGAARALAGSFHPAVARGSHAAASSTSVKRRFTLAF